MTEQDAAARLAAANPVPEAAVRGAADSPRAHLLLRSVLARPRRRPGLLPLHRPVAGHGRWRYALVPLVVAAAVATGVVAVDRDTARPVPAPTGTAAANPQTIASTAAQYALAGPRKGRFKHVTGTVGRVVHRTSGNGYDVILVQSVQSVQPADGAPGEGWLAIGEAGSSVRPLTPSDATAYQADGSPGPEQFPAGAPPVLAPDLAGDQKFHGAVTELPDEPTATGQEMVDWVADHGGFRVGTAWSPVPADVPGWLFREGVRLLDTFTDVLAGDQRAKIYRMLGGLSGVRTLDTPLDPLGRPAVGLAYTGSTPRHGLIDWQVFLSAESDQIAYTQAVVRQPGPANSGLAPGTVQYTTAVTSVTWSDKP
jgi:hypothetical protein